MSSNNQDNARQQQIAIRITQVLHVTTRQYDAFKMRYGRAFLQSYISNYPELIDEILEKQAYWNWWEKHYLLRDETFLNTESIHCINTQILGAMYSTIHNPYNLVKELVVDSTIFEGLPITPKPAV